MSAHRLQAIVCGGQRTTCGNGFLHRMDASDQTQVTRLDGSIIAYWVILMAPISLKKKKKPNKSSTTCSPSTIPLHAAFSFLEAPQMFLWWTQMPQVICQDVIFILPQISTGVSSSGLYSALSETFWGCGQRVLGTEDRWVTQWSWYKEDLTPTKGFVCTESWSIVTPFTPVARQPGRSINDSDTISAWEIQYWESLAQLS